MHLLKKTIDFVAYSNLFVALGAVMACYGTITGFGAAMPNVYYYFMFCATLCSYSLHWYFTPNAQPNTKEAWSLKNKTLLGAFTVLSALAALYTFYFLPSTIKLHMVLLAILALLYTAPKIPFKPFTELRPFVIAKTLYLSLAWFYATVVIPIVARGFGFSNKTIHYGLHKFFLIFMVCLLFDLKDKKLDQANGIKSFIYQFSNPISGIVIQFFCSVSILSALYLFNYLSVTYVVMHLLAVLLLLVTFKQTLNTQNNYWYYFLVDGIVFVSGALLFLIHLF